MAIVKTPSQARSNWGRWGAEDERGALNLLTPERVTAALGEVRDGVVHSLGMRIQREGVPVYPARNPALHLMSIDGGDYAAGVRLKWGDFQAADDYIFLATHGTTHVDALSHAWYGGQMYNGFDPNRVRSYGATRLGIEKAEWIVGRGVLLDLPRHLGVAHLERGRAVTAADLEACCEARGASVLPGDIVLLRTGWPQTYELDPDRYFEDDPGLSVDGGTWLAERDISVIGADNGGIECQLDSGSQMEVHKLYLRDLGIHMIELLDLEKLSEHLDGLGRATFLFVAAPLKITGGVGSPLNPLAIT